MANKNSIEVMGTVVDAQPNAMFKVKLENGFEVLEVKAGDDWRAILARPKR